MRPWIHTYSGGAVDLDNPTPSQIEFVDIARSLSRLQRWCGHSHRPFSVAEHSVVVAQLVSEMVPGERYHGTAVRRRDLIAAALFHDAHEAYTGDISSPLKTLIPGLKQIQKGLQRAIEKRLLGLETDRVGHVVHLADLMSISLERDQLLPPCARPWDWEPPTPAKQIELQCLDPEDAFDLFVQWCADCGIEAAQKIIDEREQVDIDAPIPYSIL